MKITNKSKKAATPPIQVAEFISKALTAPDEQLVDILGSIESWKWPRSDLNAWIKVLNKFDSILEEIINQYELDKVQLVTFPSQTKALVSEILRFERLLLENSTNRKTFSSYDRLNSLLLCSDLDIVLLSLNVLLRPAQQYSSQSSVSHVLSFATPRLLALAKRWPHLREYGVNLVDLVSNKKNAEIEGLPVEAREVSYNFYKTDATMGAPQDRKKDEAVELPTTPSKSQTSQNASSAGPINVFISESTLRTQSPMRILADCVRVYRVPDEDKFELLSRIRASQALYNGHESERGKLIIARLLAIAIYAHTHSESQATTTFFLYEPDLISNVADLLHVEYDVSVTVQTAAIAVLDAFTRYRNRCQEVLTAVNAGVNHGILMALLRKTVNDVANPSSSVPQAFVEALLQFVTLIATHTSGVNMIVGAGLIPLLIQLVENKLPNRLPIVSKTLQLIDSVLYTFQNGFALFCAAHGVNVLVDRIENEVDFDIQEYGHNIRLYDVNPINNELPITRTSVLKHLLRTMHRMMQSSGTSEGLRGLIDTSLVKSIKKVIDNRGLFGPSVLPLAINIMATFVHNEPTSLSVIQEAGLPESFYKAIEAGIEPSIEVIQSIPNALGALCLNETGQAQLSNRPSIIPAIFTIFTSERHLKVLIDKENAVIIGTAIDELVRHHPLLKAAVFASLKSTMSAIEDIGTMYQIPNDLLHWYKLIPTATGLVDSDVKMDDAERAPIPGSEGETADISPLDVNSGNEDLGPKAHDSTVVSFIDILCRFLEGFFQHGPHCKDFISLSDGLKYIGRLTALPCLPYDFSNSVASDSLVQVMRTLVDCATNETILHLAKIVRASLQETNDFWQNLDPSSKLSPFLEISDTNQVGYNDRFRSLVILHIRVSLLSDVFSTAGYSHGRGAIALLQTLMGSPSGQAIPELGALHRATIWENMTLNAALSGRGITQTSPAQSPLNGTPNQSTTNLIEATNALNSGINSANGIQPIGGAASSREKTVKPKQDETPLSRNAAALKYLTHGIPNVLAPFFQAIVKMFHARRNPELAQKKQIGESAAVVADVMLKHLQIPHFDDVPSLYTYFSVILGLYTLLFVDERTSTNTLHTVELKAFYQIGGFDEILKVCLSFVKSIEDITGAREEERSEVLQKTLIHAYGGIKVALHLLHPIISAKPLFESPQTLLLITRDKKETESGFFDPNNFLVKLRLKVLSLLQSLWEAPWLVQAPLGVSKSIVRSVLEVVNGENEQSKPETISDNAAPHASRPTGPDEHRVQMLVDMGFPRFAAERALIHTRNNVNAATDFLLTHPFAFVPDPEPANTQPAVASPEVTDESAPAPVEVTGGAAPGEHSIPANTSEPSSSEPQVEEPKEGVKTVEEWKKELDEAREPLRRLISRQALLLVDEHQSLLFELHTAFVRPSPHQPQAIRDLIEDINSFSPYAYDVQEQPLANRCRLLALVLCEAPSSLDENLRKELLDGLLALLLSGIDPENPPKWLASHLLVSEALLTLAEEPRLITLPKEDESINPEPLSVGLPRADAKNIIFDFCLRLLAVRDLPSDELLSVLRLLVYFSKDRQMVKQFIASDGLVHLFRRIGTSEITGGSSYIITILRHITEDRDTVYNIMSQSITRYFAHPRNNVVDVATFVRNCNAIAFRDTDVFLDATKALCSLNHAYSFNPHIVLKSNNKEKDKKGIKGKETGTAENEDVEMQAEPTAVIPAASSDQHADNVIHLLISELMLTTKAINEIPTFPSISKLTGAGEAGQAAVSPETQPTLSALTNQTEERQAIPAATGVNTDDKYQYACFLMQCLTELLFSYDTCKAAFLSYAPKKRNQTPSKEPIGKFRSVVLQFLLNDVINPGSVIPSPSERVRQHLGLCNWAMSTIVSLCVDTSSAVQEAKDVSPELVSVRKFVLETLSRSLKDVASIENLETRYGKLLAYADLCHRLLTVRFNTPNTSNRKQQEEIPTHIAKIMLEKNFVATLTTTLSELDLNYPNIRNLVASILRPLQYLTKIAIKMSRGAKNREAEDTRKGDSESSVISSEDEGSDDMSEDAREETPDLYRNSALGMYAGEMDDGQFSGSDEMDEDEEDEGDVEMDFGDATGSEATSDETDESDEHELEEDEGQRGETWGDVDEREEDEDEEQDLIETHDVDSEQDDIEDEEDDVEEEADEEGNLLWEDVPPPIDDGMAQIGDDMDEEDEHGVPIQIMQHEEEDPDMASDDEGFRFENGVFSADNGLPFGGPFINIPAGRDPPPVFVSRRSRSDGDDLQVFGRARNAPAPPPETITHPLLLDTSNNSTRLAPNVRRAPRHPQRSIAIGADIFQTIDDIMGPGSTQFLQQILAAAPEGAHALQFDMGNMANFDRLHRRPNQGVISAAIRVERGPRNQAPRQGREFDPLLTLQRWTEEAKILNGEFVSERSGKLVNHVILALLPAAAEAAKKAKEEKEEKEEKEAEEKAIHGKEEVKAPQEAETEKQESQQQSSPVPEVASSTVIADEENTRREEGTTTSVEQAPADEQAMEVVPADQDAPMADATTTETNEHVPEESNANASISNPAPQRITVMIHGSPVDITDTGIDPTFLEALPDDMREEVLNQHVRDQRASTVERPADSQISAEFLDALPPEIRAEIIQQEAMERARQRVEETAAQPTQAADIDPASFIASLDPNLRQTVLIEQHEGFLQTLPAHIFAEARDFSSGARRATQRNPPRIPGTGAPPRKVTTDHDAIQLLDKPGIAALVRLLFFPQVSKKNLLFKVLVNLCENAKTRMELFNILLGILQDGTGDLAAVDKSFSQLTVRNTKPQTPKSAGKHKATSEYLTANASPSARIDAVPDLIVQRCLESLTYIVSANELASLFFLTEHELPAGLRRSSSKKGKGKEKQAPQTHYPIVLLLGLLDRQPLIRTPAIMESVVGLLATVTRPLTSLKPKHVDSPPLPSATDATPATATPDITTLAASTQDNSQPPAQANPPVTSATSLNKDPKTPLETLEEKVLLANPPQIPHAVLRLIVNILTVGECSGRTFQQSLALIQHLSHIPDAREVIAQELRSKAEEFGHALYADLDELVAALQGPQDQLNAAAAKFSPASSLQAKLLRVLKTIDYMYSSKAPPMNTNEVDIDKVQTIYESFRFTPLWQRLGDCLSIIGEKPETEHIAIVLLPLIETLMVVCKYAGPKPISNSLPRALRGSMSPRTPTTPRESMEDLFISFTDTHRKVLNVMVRNNPSLMSGSFALLVNNPRVLDFDNKRNYFNQQLHRRPATRDHYGTLQLNVRRARVFEDSFQYLQRKTGDQIKYGKLSVRFYDEEGVDAGGVTREWFQILARQMFDPNNALFQPCAADKLTYQPNKNSWVNPEHLSFFKFVGRVIGKAIYDGRLLDAYFAKSLYRQILGKPVDYRDVEWVDPEYYNSLCWILENDPTVLDLTFSVEADEFGVSRIVSLKENGEAIPVTQDNKREFVQLSAQYRLYSSIKDQIEHLLSGFYEIIPKDLITIFNEQELELLISGTPDIDVDEWRAATEYNGYSSSDPNIVWWWRALKSFNREERAKVLSFATGTSRVPLNGFIDLQGVQGVQRFSIHRAYGEPDRLPQAHTCFNQIDLPQYSSYEMLRQQLLLAINEGGEGFAFS